MSQLLVYRDDDQKEKVHSQLDSQGRSDGGGCLELQPEPQGGKRKAPPRSRRRSLLNGHNSKQLLL